MLVLNARSFVQRHFVIIVKGHQKWVVQRAEATLTSNTLAVLTGLLCAYEAEDARFRMVSLQ